MTIEEKAKAYDEAIAQAKIILKTIGNATLGNLVLKNEFEIMFPELKSEDEKIRMWLIRLISTAGYRILDSDPMPCSRIELINWLEKQAEHANFRNKIQIGDKVTRNRDGMLVNLSQLNRVAKKDENQEYQKPTETVKWSPQEESCICQLESLVKEQWRQAESVHNSVNIKKMSELMFFLKTLNPNKKPADKVEPKFKVGNKIYLKPEYRMPNDDTPIANTVFEIKAIDDKHYRFDSSYIFIEDQDKYELVEQKPAWTIQNAKDGDVLACPNDAGDRDVVFIFKNMNSDEGWVFCFCASDANGCFCTNNDYVGNINSTNISPATKEQRDLLFKKMHEAGYEWDAEKKELKKIEQTHVIEMKTPEKSLGIDSDTYNKIVDECVYGEQKPADWSEKYIADVFEMVGLAKIVREQGNDALTEALQFAMIELAKYSVVPQPKQEWDEKDKCMLNNVIDTLKPLSQTTHSGYAINSMIDWLKSLKERIQPHKDRCHQ